MKYGENQTVCCICSTSHPARGAWIEMQLLPVIYLSPASRPAWGAWIEIATCQRMEKEDVQSRPAWGAWIEIRAIRLPMGRLAVAPRMGRVD